MHLDLLLECLEVDLCLRVARQPALPQLPLEVGDTCEHRVEVVRLDVHLGQRVQIWNTGFLELLVLLDSRQRFEERSSHVLGLGISLWHVGSDLADTMHQGQRHRQDLAFRFRTHWRRRLPVLHGAGLTRQEDIDDPLHLGLIGLYLVGHDLAARGGDQDTPAPIRAAVAHGDQAPRVEEGGDVFGPRHDLPQFLALLVHLFDDVVVVCDRLIDVEVIVSVVFDHNSQVVNPRELHL
mmetsp:Transcript_30828/g.88597  ORF Transcript_30828/g.88597 Transcript_30828/m.88597 type:complete len:237 (+) Transcript_30828:725-1435(+)